jgi:hypothetical protein
VVSAGAFTIAHRQRLFQRSNSAAMVCVSALGYGHCLAASAAARWGKASRISTIPAAAQDRIICDSIDASIELRPAWPMLRRLG